MIPGFVEHELRRYENQAASAQSHLLVAREIMDIVRAVNNRPRANAHLRCIDSVKAADNRLMQLAERKASEMVAHKLHLLRGLRGSEDFCIESKKLRQELRYLLPAVGRVAIAAERALVFMENSMQKLAPVARERGERGG
jgi:hypothetical protein